MGFNASSSSSSSSSTLAPGFRFHPTDEELVIYYLKRKVCGKPFHIDAISEIDIYKFEPWDLPDRSRLKSRDLEWYFFSGLDKKYGNGWRTNRATDQGYWKTTGKDRPVKRGQRLVGMKKTLVFHLGRAPHGQRTNWVMHEYRLADANEDQSKNHPIIPKDAFVLCRVFRKSGPGPKNGEQYGAPFLEEEWEWDDELVPKTELLSEGYCNLTNNDHLQMQEQQQFTENPLVSMPQNDFLVGINDEVYLEKPGESSEGDKKVSTGTDEYVGLPDEKIINSPELFRMDGTPNENEYFTLDEFLNPEDDNHHAEDLVGGELTPIDALQEPAISNGAFATLNDPNSFDADQNSFQLLDEYLQYFNDADIDSDFVGLKSSAISEAGVPYLNDAVLTEETVNLQNNQAATLALPESPEVNCDPGASSSENKQESPLSAADAKYSNGWDNSIAKQVSRMLGSIPAPTAFAAEIPTKDAAFRQNVSARSSSPVHVTAGIIHISGMTVYGSDKMWSLGKGANVDLFLPYGMTIGGMDLISSSYEGTDNTVASKATTVILRSGLYFMFLWILLLSASCKIGSYIYTR